MPRELIEVLAARLGGWLRRVYGLTETSPVITTTAPSSMRPGLCGRAMGDTELKVADAEGTMLPDGEFGELWARGTAISAGYYGQPEATAAVFTADGWFKTGDLVRMDDEGYVCIVDRAKDMINVGGEKVYPRTSRNSSTGIPPSPTPLWSGSPIPTSARSSRRTSHSTPVTPYRGRGDRLSATAAGPFKVPRLVEFVDDTPQPLGKALRRLLR